MSAGFSPRLWRGSAAQAFGVLPLRPLFGRVLLNGGLIRYNVAHHAAVGHNALAGDAVGARCAMVMHLTYNRQTIVELWKKHQNQS